MNKIIVPAITALLVLTIGLSQDVYGPEEKPEKISLAGTGYDSATGEFEITALVQLPKDALSGYTVDTTVDLFKPDGTPIRAGASTDTVPQEGVSEGGNNHSVHKLTIRMSYDPRDDDIEGQRVQVVVSSDLIDPDGYTVDQKTKKSWKKLDVDGIIGP